MKGVLGIRGLNLSTQDDNHRLFFGQFLPHFRQFGILGGQLSILGRKLFLGNVVLVNEWIFLLRRGVSRPIVGWNRRRRLRGSAPISDGRLRMPHKKGDMAYGGIPGCVTKGCGYIKAPACAVGGMGL